MERLNVMIADDSILATQMLKIAFESLGHKVVRTVGNGVEAVTAYKICNPDLVTMNITMPGLDGISATQQIMKSFPDARIIVVSPHAHQKAVMDALKAGAKGFLLKPVHPAKLRGTLERVFDMKFDRKEASNQTLIASKQSPIATKQSPDAAMNGPKRIVSR